MPPTLRIILYLTIDAVLLAVSFWHVPAIMNRPRAPFEVSKDNNKIVISQVVKTGIDLQVGDELIQWKDHAIPIPEAVEFLSDMSSIAERIPVKYMRNGTTRATAISLIPTYDSPRYVIIMLFVGVVIWFLAIFILVNRPRDLSARATHWSMIAFSAVIMTDSGVINPSGLEGMISRAVFFAAYAGVATGFCFLTTVFPKPPEKIAKIKTALIFVPVCFMCFLLEYYQLRAIQFDSVSDYVQFQMWFDAFHFALVAYALWGIFNLIKTYRQAHSTEERQQLQWISWGFAIGLLPFFSLIILPELISPKELIPQEYAAIFYLAIPFSFAMAFMKHRLLNVEIVINRSIVYGGLSVLVIASYALTVLLVTSVFRGQVIFSEYFFVAALTLAVALFIAPVRDRLQRTIDETFFPAKSRFREEVKAISEQLHGTLSSEEFFHQVTGAIERLVPVSTVAIYKYENLMLTIEDIRGLPIKKQFYLSEKNAKSVAAPKIYALPTALNFERADVDVSRSAWLKRLGISILVPLLTESNELIGFVAINGRSPDERFNEEEIDLLVTVCNQAAIALQRLLLQERIILQREQKRRAEELSNLKSLFVSSVSHELRTPLTSIKMFAEMLRTGKSTKEQKEYLEIIEGETERLTRLINNVLDFAKIERGVKEYTLEPVDVNDVIQRTVSAMRYQFTSHKATLRVSIPQKLPAITVDVDALEEAILNLLSNALKYSLTKKEVLLRIHRKSNHIVIEVKDNGIGIPESEISKIFEPFHRARHDRSPHVGGTGLGLSLVKHFVDAQKGSISIESKVGKGSTFTIRLPISSAKSTS